MIQISQSCHGAEISIYPIL